MPSLAWRISFLAADHGIVLKGLFPCGAPLVQSQNTRWPSGYRWKITLFPDERRPAEKRTSGRTISNTRLRGGERLNSTGSAFKVLNGESP